MTLLDTNVLIYASERGSPYHEWARATVAEAVSVDGAAINSVCLAEYCCAARRRRGESPDCTGARRGRFLDGGGSHTGLGH